MNEQPFQVAIYARSTSMGILACAEAHALKEHSDLAVEMQNASVFFEEKIGPCREPGSQALQQLKEQS